MEDEVDAALALADTVARYFGSSDGLPTFIGNPDHQHSCRGR